MSDFTQPRITERMYLTIPPTALTADGTVEGVISIANTYCFKVGQCVLFKQGATFLKAKIKQILSETQFIVIDMSESVTTNKKLDMSGFLAGSTVELMGNAKERKRPVIDLLEIQRAVYEEEPTVALRSHLVDWLGRSYDTTNPMPVQLSDGSINIGTVNAELEVQLSHKDNFPDAGDVRDAVNVVDNFLIKRFEKINNITYEGLADQGSLPSEAKWRITRTIKQPNGDLVTSIVGDTSYDQVWNDRAILFSPATPIDFFDRKWEKILPILNNANFLKLGNFDAVVPSFSGNIATINYFEGGANIARITVRYVHELDWDMNLESFINDTNNDILLDDDGSPLILE